MSVWSIMVTRRLVYTTRFNGVVYVSHVFKKIVTL